MTLFFLEEPTNIKDAWKIHIKFALDFFNSIKTMISAYNKNLYINIGSFEPYQSWLKENNNARGVWDIFVGCQSLYLRYSFHVADGVGRSRPRVMIRLKNRKGNALLNLFVRSGLSSASCKFIKLIMFCSCAKYLCSC